MTSVDHKGSDRRRSCYNGFHVHRRRMGRIKMYSSIEAHLPRLCLERRDFLVGGVDDVVEKHRYLVLPASAHTACSVRTNRVFAAKAGVAMVVSFIKLSARISKSRPARIVKISPASLVT